MSVPQEMKLANEEVQAQADKLQELAELLDIACDSIIVRELDGMIRFWNRVAEETYGWSKKEAIGMVTHSLLANEFPMALDVSEPEMLPCRLIEPQQLLAEIERHIAKRAE